MTSDLKGYFRARSGGTHEKYKGKKRLLGFLGYRTEGIWEFTKFVLKLSAKSG